MKRKEIVWNIRVPLHLNELLEEYIKRDAYKTKSEFIRTAVREKLEKELRKFIDKEKLIGSNSSE